VLHLLAQLLILVLANFFPPPLDYATHGLSFHGLEMDQIMAYRLLTRRFDKVHGKANRPKEKPILFAKNRETTL
jgi:hypothetical protein